jgi:hypothetical protein
VQSEACFALFSTIIRNPYVSRNLCWELGMRDDFLDFFATAEGFHYNVKSVGYDVVWYVGTGDERN